ncbi:MAG: type II toxin-antitoxin system RelE/ParE family toxin [Blautia sp.]|nr:type II toxin-antitoxin system RelE/ParE family toxin [Blautia sp.]
MSEYRVDYAPEAVKQLKKMDKATQKMILGWIQKNLVGCTDPRAHGKGLTADKSGKWRYRIGDYRVLAVIHDEEIVIHVIRIGHRREVYRR